ncbi:MAG: AAA family ATPase [Halanaerobiales bacterium]
MSENEISKAGTGKKARVDVEELLADIEGELDKVIIEQEKLIELTLICLLCGGHVLLEGVPGLAKTLLVRALAQVVEVDFKRVQFTPDLMPADITGTRVYNMKNREFELKKGPVFTNFLLGDEINRTPPKTQSGLLEAMEEQSVTIDGQTYQLPSPYMVIATQNPLEYEGTYPLPEALVDRFLLKVLLDYPSPEAESDILDLHARGFSSVELKDWNLESVCGPEEIMQARKQVQEVQVDDNLRDYIVAINGATRENSSFEVGSSPRGSIALLKTARACAAYRGRDYVIPEDIKEMAVPSLRHRVILKPELELEGVTPDSVIEEVLNGIEVPR